MTDLTHLTYHRDGTFWGNATAGVREYQHEHMEGPHISSFALEAGEGAVDDAGLRAWFDNRIMTQFATTFEGREVWRGYVWEMELQMGGEVRVKSMADMANAVKTLYTNTDGDRVHTGWKTHAQSRTNFGTKERVVTASSSSLDEADERANVELQYSASPYTAAITYRETEKHRLLVTVAGRAVVANNVQMLTDTMRVFDKIDDTSDPLYTFSGTDSEWPNNDNKRPGEPGNTITVGDEIRRIILIIKYSGGWLFPRSLAANDTETVVGVSSNVPAFDRMLELAKLRNSDGDFYRLTVENDGGVVYQRTTEDVDYLRYPLPRGLENPDGTKPTWGAKPGIVKYVDVYGGPALPVTQFNDRRLTFYPRTVMRDGAPVVEFMPRDFGAADIYGALDANRRAIERQKPAAQPATKPAKPAKRDIYGHDVPNGDL